MLNNASDIKVGLKEVWERLFTLPVDGCDANQEPLPAVIKCRTAGLAVDQTWQQYEFSACFCMTSCALCGRLYYLDSVSVAIGCTAGYPIPFPSFNSSRSGIHIILTSIFRGDGGDDAEYR